MNHFKYLLYTITERWLASVLIAVVMTTICYFCVDFALDIDMLWLRVSVATFFVLLWIISIGVAMCTVYPVDMLDTETEWAERENKPTNNE